MLGLTQFSPKWLFLGVFKNSDIVRATRLTLGAVPLKDLVSEEPFLLLCFLPFVAEAVGPPPAPPRVTWSRGRGWGLDAGGKAPRGPARWTGTLDRHAGLGLASLRRLLTSSLLSFVSALQ